MICLAPHIRDAHPHELFPGLSTQPCGCSKPLLVLLGAASAQEKDRQCHAPIAPGCYLPLSTRSNRTIPIAAKSGQMHAPPATRGQCWAPILCWAGLAPHRYVQHHQNHLEPWAAPPWAWKPAPELGDSIFMGCRAGWGCQGRMRPGDVAPTFSSAAPQSPRVPSWTSGTFHSGRRRWKASSTSWPISERCPPRQYPSEWCPHPSHPRIPVRNPALLHPDPNIPLRTIRGPKMRWFGDFPLWLYNPPPSPSSRNPPAPVLMPTMILCTKPFHPSCPSSVVAGTWQQP